MSLFSLPIIKVDLKTEIENLLNAIDLGMLYVLDVHIGGLNKKPKIMITMDSDTGISIDDCANISRIINNEISEKILIEDNYTLEVSSPGADKPLKLPRQFTKNIGRTLKLVLEGGKEASGVLESTEIDGITLGIEKTEKIEKKKVVTKFSEKFKYSEIKKANVIITF